MAEVIVLENGLITFSIDVALKYWKDKNMPVPKEYIHLLTK